MLPLNERGLTVGLESSLEHHDIANHLSLESDV